MLLRPTARALAVGENGNGSLGDGTNTSRSFPVRINVTGETDTRWKAVAAGWQHTLAIKSDGTLWAWGFNLHGQSGRALTYSSWNKPFMLDGGQWTTVAAGWYHSLAVKSNGSVYTWGDNTYGQLGDGSVAGIMQQVSGMTASMLLPSLEVCTTNGADPKQSTRGDAILPAAWSRRPNPGPQLDYNTR
jgi:alpha-tubulin suppressor-like RCC1 family protein